MALRTKKRESTEAPAPIGIPQQKDRNPILVVGGAVVRAIGNVIVIAVLAAAGLGGWLAADEYLVPRIEGTVAVGAASEWPPELGRATPWPVYESNWTSADGSRSSIIFEPSTNTVVAATTVADGLPATLVEWSGPLLAVKPPDAAWQIRTGAAEQDATRDGIGDQIVSPRLPDVLAGGVSRHSIVREVTGQLVVSPEDTEAGIVRWFEVTVDAEAFRRDDPIAFGRSHPRVSDRSGVFTWTIGTDADGRIMRWDGIREGASVSLRPVELPDLQSPIATQVALARDRANASGDPADAPTPAPAESRDPAPADGSDPAPVETPAPADGSTPAETPEATETPDPTPADG